MTATDLATWLRAQLDEDEQIARAAAQEAHYAAWATSGGNVIPAEPHGNEWIAVGPWEGELGEIADHIARHDPASVLADIAAKRAIVDLHKARQHDELNLKTNSTVSTAECGYCASLCHSGSGLWCEPGGDAPYPCDTLRLLAQPYRDRPGWRGEWAVDE